MTIEILSIKLQYLLVMTIVLTVISGLYFVIEFDTVIELFVL